MAFLGTLFNVAKVGVGLLNGLVNPPSDYELIQELADGTSVRIRSRMVLLHPKNPSMVGKLLDPRDIDQGALTLQLITDQNGDNQVYAVNNDPDTDAIGSFSSTLPAGEVSQTQTFVARHDPVIPSGQEVTSDFLTYPQANLTASAVQLTTSQLGFAIDTVGSADVVSSLLSNFNVPSIASTQAYTLYATMNSDVVPNAPAATLNLSWTTDPTSGQIDGYQAASTLTFPATVTANVIWNNPLQSLTVSVEVPPGTTAVGSIPPNNRPISSANISATTPDTSPEFVKLLVKNHKPPQSVRKVLFKGRPKLVYTKKATSSC